MPGNSRSLLLSPPLHFSTLRVLATIIFAKVLALPLQALDPATMALLRGLLDAESKCVS
jgi:hypothetical protein